MPDNGSNRLDRIERALELLIDDHVQFRQDLKQLLTAQVLLTEAHRKLELTVEEVAGKLNALIQVVDGIVRGRQ
jgi:hypothetical protein